MTPRLRLPLAAAVALTAASAAQAHPGAAHVHALADGLLHPLTGADHLIAMIAVGLVAARLGPRPGLLTAAGFVVAMALGAGLGTMGLAVGATETGIALSLLVLGALAALHRPIPAGAAVAVATVSGLVHGLAHGAEAPMGGATASYLVGMVATTVVLHGLGYLAGRGAFARVAAATTGFSAVAVGAASLAGLL